MAANFAARCARNFAGGEERDVVHGHIVGARDRRALHVVDHLVIGVALNDAKGPLFSTDERVEIVRDEIAHLDNGGAERIETSQRADPARGVVEGRWRRSRPF